MNPLSRIVSYVLTPRLFAVLIVLLAMISVPGFAQDNKGVSVAAKAGTLGLGYELAYRFNEKFDARLVSSKFDKSYTDTLKGNPYTGALELGGTGLLGDWHPTGGTFYLSFGAISNGNALKARTTGDSFMYKDSRYEGYANAQADFKSIAPYFGFGWSNRENRHWSFDFEIGALFQGAVKVRADGSATYRDNTCAFSVNDSGVATVTFDGNLAENLCATGRAPGRLKSDLEAEHRELKDDINLPKTWPVISFGLQYRF